MSTIIILRGNSGSGKTTIAKALQKRFGLGTMLISQDVVRREMIYVRDRPDNKAIDLLISLIVFAENNCDITILEGILSADIYRKLFNTIVEIYTNNIYSYYFDIPFDETLKRHSQKPNADEFGEPQMRGWWKEKDFLSNIDEKIINETMSKDDVLNYICNDFSGSGTIN